MFGSFQNTGYNDVVVCILFLSHFFSREMPLPGMESGMDSSFVSLNDTKYDIKGHEATETYAAVAQPK